MRLVIRAFHSLVLRFTHTLTLQITKPKNPKPASQLNSRITVLGPTEMIVQAERCLFIQTKILPMKNAYVHRRKL